jgi:hypothetical protein
MEPDLSVYYVFSVASSPHDNASLRDLEPLVGHLVRHATVEDLPSLQRLMSDSVKNEKWDAVQRGGYLFDLLWAFGDNKVAIQTVLSWIDTMSEDLLALPAVAPIPFFPTDTRQVTKDCLANRWKLSSGILYERLKQMREYPYVC